VWPELPSQVLALTVPPGQYQFCPQILYVPFINDDVTDFKTWLQVVYPNVGFSKKKDRIRVAKSDDFVIIFLLKKANIDESPLPHSISLAFPLLGIASLISQPPFSFLEN
jgi:hypothetical protein